jgi:outer membrane protein assembly factor BamD
MMRFVLALVLLPPEELYALGERKLEQRTYSEARDDFKKIVERHPNSSLAPRARFLVGEAYYREAEFDKAAKEFETFLAFYPRHQIADLVQYRYAMSYYDQMKPVEQDQGLTAKALEQFRKLVKEYPESRYATEALAKIDVCRGRLAQKEVWVATYYFNQGNRSAARQRLELVLKEYPRTLVIPETLYVLAEVNFSEGRTQEATGLLRQLASEYGFTEWGRRAAQRLRAQR